MKVCFIKKQSLAHAATHLAAFKTFCQGSHNVLNKASLNVDQHFKCFSNVWPGLPQASKIFLNPWAGGFESSGLAEALGPGTLPLPCRSILLFFQFEVFGCLGGQKCLKELCCLGLCVCIGGFEVGRGL